MSDTPSKEITPTKYKHPNNGTNGEKKFPNNSTKTKSDESNGTHKGKKPNSEIDAKLTRILNECDSIGNDDSKHQKAKVSDNKVATSTK